MGWSQTGDQESIQLGTDLRWFFPECADSGTDLADTGFAEVSFPHRRPHSQASSALSPPQPVEECMHPLGELQLVHVTLTRTVVDRSLLEGPLPKTVAYISE